MIKVTFFSDSPSGACHLYRVDIPIKELNKTGKIFAQFSMKWLPGVADDDLFIFQRNSTRNAIRLMSALMNKNQAMVYDVDDDIFHIPPSNPVFNLYLNLDDTFPDTSIMSRQVAGIRFSSAVSVTCGELKRIYRVINPRIWVLPNCIRREDWDGLTGNLKDEGKIRLFWGGSPTHQQDLKVIELALTMLNKKYDNIEIIIMGDDTELSTKVSRIPFGSYKFFQRVMASCQIGLAPMADNQFNRCKSDLRIKELGAAGLPIVASAVGEYDKEESGAILCRTIQEWVEALSALIENEKLRKQKAEDSRAWAYSWDISNHIYKWVDMIEELVSDHTRRSDSEIVRVQDNKRPSYAVDSGTIRVEV